MIQVGQSATPAMFGISSPAQASALGLTISAGLTGIFWVFLVFVISLVVSLRVAVHRAGPPGDARIPGIILAARGRAPGNGRGGRPGCGGRQ